MAIIKLRVHNDLDNLMIVELYEDDGTFVECEMIGGMYDFEGAVLQLLHLYPTPIKHCTAEQLIS